jgi:sigma-B regulation protein RsbU (phosphoserine phosphatase)
MSMEVISTLTQRLKQSDNLTIIDLREKNRLLRDAYRDLKEAQDQIVRQERLERELELARGIQSSFLPTKVPSLEGYNFACYITPASAVGGDFYDFVRLSTGQLGIGVGDVSDHGIASALLMAQATTLLRVEARHGPAPQETLSAMNEEMMARDHMGMFLTMLYGLLDPATGLFQFARAGHTTPIIMDPAGRVRQIEGGRGQPLGLVDEPQLDIGQVELAPGCLLLLYTDGVTETANEAGELFGTSRVLEFLERAGPGATAEDVCQGLHAALSAFRGEAVQADDVTSLAIKVDRAG